MARRKVQHAAQSDLFAEAPAAAIDGFVWAWGHRVLPTEALRYSITFRTARTA